MPIATQRHPSTRPPPSLQEMDHILNRQNPL